MNTYQKVEKAAENIGIRYIGDDVDPGNNKKYITCNIYDERVEFAADDRVQETSKGLYVHLFLPKSTGFFKAVRDLQNALEDQGLNFPELVNNSIEGSTRHITLETADEEREDY